MSQLKLCNKCRINNEPYCCGYIGWLKDDCYSCPICGGNLEDTIISKDDYKIIDSISDDVQFLEAMIDLKKKDPIEYQLKMSQFKANLKQQEQVQESRAEENKPRCPTCGSTNIQKISGTKRWFSTGLFGLASSDIGKSMCCKKCGYKW